jgi:hypothetical protein
MAAPSSNTNDLKKEKKKEKKKGKEKENKRFTGLDGVSPVGPGPGESSEGGPPCPARPSQGGGSQTREAAYPSQTPAETERATSSCFSNSNDDETH